jgi:hypothetical protein
VGVEAEMNDEDLAATKTKNIDGPYHLESLETSLTNTAIGRKKNVSLITGRFHGDLLYRKPDQARPRTIRCSA